MESAAAASSSSSSSSDDENPNENNNMNNQNQSSDFDGKALNNSVSEKPKRVMKTPSQLESLEKAFSFEKYPSEATRAELSEKLGLSDRQLQMWFCHRRLKGKREASGMGDQKGGGGSVDDMDIDDESEQEAIAKEVVSCVEAQLGEAMREDGPILGVEFDLLPEDAFSATMARERRELSAHPYGAAMHAQRDARPNKAASRPVHEYQGRSSFKSDNGQVRQSQIYDSNLADLSIRASSFVPKLPHVHGLGHASKDHHVSQPERQGHPIRSFSGDDDCQPHDKNHESGEQTRKDIEKQDRERRKEEERLMRERQRAEERSQRELRREMERREKFLQREHLRAENRRKKDKLRAEREELKRRAAIEKATSRRLAKESMELIEDEQLELMELAAKSKGLPSIVHLDYETLQNLESFQDSLCSFPPKSVILNKPFAVQPWVDSDENIGNLLMVWKFLVAFADILELWPFTFDEFIQALHDYDSRLLGEMHIALINIIIKDIEDAARTPITGLGTNQSSAAIPEGGHPKIVEGAYTWGFDICNWRQHLNPLTWPEILRQLALSAGFGPHLKQKNTAPECPDDSKEIKDCQDIMSAIRNGSAAERAVAKMRNRGMLGSSRSRHRLTPGTLKFAAFHVLSLEGSKGLNLIQIAEKVQRFGLRDLTKSKAPEASISVAMNRDTKLFERVAPSTYRVKAPYRKDPADAQSILAEARKKIQTFENGSVAGEDGGNVKRCDDVEKGEESECDVDEAMEVDDVHTPYAANKNTESNNEGNAGSRSAKDAICNNGAPNMHIECSKELSSSFSGSKDINGSKSASGQVGASNDVGARNLDNDCDEIDKSESAESWVEGLTEGEYSTLTVEDRLNAVVALISIANEGNVIRCVLEDRMENTNILRKQMLVEAQLDKSRLKDESIIKSDCFPHINSAEENVESPLPINDNKSTEPFTSAETQTLLPVPQGHQNNLNGLPSERALIEEPATGLDNLSAQQLGCASRRSHSQLKSYIAHRAEDMYVYRSLPLGQDRRHNRYWQFVASPSKNDPGTGRIIVELHDGKWRLINSEEAFDALLKSLDTRGIRESHLHIMLQNIEPSFRENVRKNLNSMTSMSLETSFENGVTRVDCKNDFAPDGDRPSSSVCSSLGTLEASSIRIELMSNEEECKGALERYRDLQKWMWGSCFNLLSAMSYGRKRSEQLVSICDDCLNCYFFEDIQCPSCHKTFGTENTNVSYKVHFSQCGDNRKSNHGDLCSLKLTVPVGIRLLKALLACVEVSIPPEGLESFWTKKHRRIWGRKVDAASSTLELLQMLTVLESAIKPTFLRSDFQTTKSLLASCSMLNAPCDYADLEGVTVLPWIPETTAAVFLKLLELDASIIYTVEEEVVLHEDREIEDHWLPSGLAAATNANRDVVQVPKNNLNRSMKEDIASHISRHNSSKQGRKVLEQGFGSKGQKKVSGVKTDIGGQNDRDNGNLDQGLRERNQRLQSHGRGPRTVRKRRAEKSTSQALLFQMDNSIKSKGKRKSIKDLAAEWNFKRVKIKPVEGANNINWRQQEPDDAEAQRRYQQENWRLGITGTTSRTGNMMVSTEENVDSSDSGEDEEDEVGENMDARDERLDAGNTNKNREEGSDLVDSDYYSD